MDNPHVQHAAPLAARLARRRRHSVRYRSLRQGLEQIRYQEPGVVPALTLQRDEVVGYLGEAGHRVSMAYPRTQKKPPAGPWGV